MVNLIQVIIHDEIQDLITAFKKLMKTAKGLVKTHKSNQFDMRNLPEINLPRIFLYNWFSL